MLSALVAIAVGLAAVDTFETRWSVSTTYDQTQCAAHGGIDVAWDEGIGVWAMKFAVQLDGTGGWIELGGVRPRPCEGGLPAGWTEWYGYVYNLGRVVKINVYWRAPFDIERGVYYNLIYPGGKHWVFTSSCLEDDAGWCLNDLNEIEVGGMRDPADLRTLCASTSNNGGVVLEAPCAPAEYCLPLQRDRQYDKAGTTWGAVKGLYH